MTGCGAGGSAAAQSAAGGSSSVGGQDQMGGRGARPRWTQRGRRGSMPPSPPPLSDRLAQLWHVGPRASHGSREDKGLLIECCWHGMCSSGRMKWTRSSQGGSLLLAAFLGLSCGGGEAEGDLSGDGDGHGNDNTGGSASGGGASGGTPSSGGDTSSGGDMSSGGGTGGAVSGCDCDAPYLPACGADGMTYDAGCGDECVPVDIACQGVCPCEGCGCQVMDGGACDLGSERQWLCGGNGHSHAAFEAGGCELLPTGSVRYCCPLTVTPTDFCL